VETALLMNDKKFPPLLPRKLRVMRAKSMKQNHFKSSGGPGGDRKNVERAGKLFGKASKSQTRQSDRRENKRQRMDNAIQTPEKFIFEGVRARSNDKVGLKFGGKRKAKSKPRRTQRAASWKKSK
jgi:nucleolar protein 12